MVLDLDRLRSFLKSHQITENQALGVEKLAVELMSAYQHGASEAVLNRLRAEFKRLESTFDTVLMQVEKEIGVS